MNNRIIFLDIIVGLFIIYGLYLEMQIYFLEPSGEVILFASFGFLILFFPFVYILEHPKVLGLNLPVKENTIWKYPHKFTIRVVIIFFALIIFSNAYLVKFVNTRFGKQREDKIKLILIKKIDSQSRHDSPTFISYDEHQNFYYFTIHSRKLFNKYKPGDSFEIKVYTGYLGKTYYRNIFWGDMIFYRFENKEQVNFRIDKIEKDNKKHEKKKVRSDIEEMIIENLTGILLFICMAIVGILKASYKK